MDWYILRRPAGLALVASIPGSLPSAGGSYVAGPYSSLAGARVQLRRLVALAARRLAGRRYC